MHFNRQDDSDDDQQHLLAAKRKYSHWYEDSVRDFLSINEEKPTARGQRLNLANRKFTQWFVGDKHSCNSIGTDLEDDISASFCNETISLYNPWLRRAYALACMGVFLIIFQISYMFFFKASRTSNLSLFPMDVFYTYIIFLRSRTGYMVNGVEERNLEKVRNMYNRSWGFTFDIFSLLPVGMLGRFIPESQQTFYAFGRQRQYVRLNFIAYYLGIREKEPGSSTVLYRTMRLFLISSLTIHLTACIWFGLACSRFDDTFSLKFCNKDSWIALLPEDTFESYSDSINDTESDDSQTSFRYDVFLTCLYWATSTTTSTGYGDVVPYTVGEKIFAILTMTVGVWVLYGMTMGGMTSLLTNADSRRSRFFHAFKAFEEEVERMGVSTKLQNMCLQYYQFLWQRWKGENVQTNGVLDILPDALRSRFAEATYKNLIGKADLLDGVEEAFCRNLAHVAQPVVYLKNQYVQKSGEIASSMCYIHHGILEVLDEEEKHVVATMHAGKLFGQILLVYDLPRVNSIRCQTNCEIFMLDRHDFRQILADYPQAAQKFVKAVRKKCCGPAKEWPLDPPSFIEFSCFIEKTSSQRFAHISSSLTMDATSSRTQTTRVRHSSTKSSSVCKTPILEDVYLDDVQQSSFDLASKIDIAKNRSQSSGATSEETRIVESNANYQDLKDAVRPYVGDTHPYGWTCKEYLIHKTLINPNGKFYPMWQNYMFYMSFCCSVYTTYLAFFCSSPGTEATYNSADAPSLDLLDIAMFTTCNSTLREIFKTRCKPFSDFNILAACIANISNSTLVTGNPPLAFNISVPATYNITMVGYNSDTIYGIFDIFFAYMIFDFSFYLNIYINLRAKVQTPTGNLESFKDIFGNYNKWHKLWFDVAAVFPLEVMSGVMGCTRLSHFVAYSLLRLNRTLNFFRNAPSTFARWENSLDVRIIKIRTIKLITYIYFVTHLCACAIFSRVCHYRAQSYIDPLVNKCLSLSWAAVAGISYKTWPFEDYITTMYWTTTTMTSTGYGDILPRTNVERILAITTMIVGTLIYGWLVAVIAATLSNAGAAAASFKNSMIVTRQFLALRNVPDPLISRVMNSRNIEWCTYKGTATPGKLNFGNDLPKHLYFMMMYESVGILLENLPFFKAVDSSLISFLCKRMQVHFFVEGDIIIYEGDLSCNLYIIKNGHCNVLTDDFTEVVDHLSRGDYFGEMEMFFGCGSPRTLVADTACEVVILLKSDLDNVLKSFPIMKQHMSLIESDDDYKQNVLDRIMHRKENNRLGIKMTEHYDILEIKGVLKYYGVKSKSTPTYCSSSKTCFEQLQGTDVLVKIVSFILLPITFNPRSHAYIIYESTRVLLILLTSFIVPLQFAMVPFNMYLVLLQYALDVLSIVDQYIRAHVMYYNERGILVTHPLNTAKHYLKTSCTLDFFSWLPIDAIAFFLLKPPLNIPQWRLIAILRLNRLLQLNKVVSYISFWLSDIRTTYRWLKLFSQLIFGLVLHHFFACVLFSTACPPATDDNSQVHHSDPDMIRFDSAISPFYCHKSTWIGRLVQTKQLPALDLLHSPYDQYVVSYYWATFTLACIGFGDVYAVLPREMAMSTVVQVIGTIFYSALLGDMSATLQNEDMHRGHYQARISEIKKFFDVYSFTKETKQQVINYYHYLWKRTHSLAPDDLLIGLPPSLHASVCQSMYEPMLKEAFGGRDMELDKDAKGFFRLLSTHIHPQFFLKESILSRRNDISDEIFFIQRGDVAILEEDDRTVERVLGPGQHFGELALLFASPQSRTIMALTNCDVNVLRRKDLDNLYERFPRFYEFMLNLVKNCKLSNTSSTCLYGEHGKPSAFHRGSVHYADGSRCDTVDNQTCAKVLKHDCLAIHCWDFITGFLCLISVQLMLYQYSFFNQAKQLYVIAYLIDIWFLADMIVSFHKSYMDQFSTTVDMISFVHSAYTWSPSQFLCDALMNAPLELVVHAFSLSPVVKISTMSFLRLNRVIRAKKLWCISKCWEENFTLNVLFFRICKFVLAMPLVAMFLSGFWYIMSCTNGVCRLDGWTNLPTTDYRAKMAYSFSLLPYVDSVYWAVATMSSTGYGDIRPVTQPEMILACLVALCGRILINRRLAHVAVTIANNESMRVWYEQRVVSMKHYMLDLQFDQKLFNHIVQYYDYVWMKNHGANIMDLFQDLPFSLRADLYTQICRKMIDNLALFKGCPENFLRHLCTVMKPASFMPGDFISIQGDIRSEMYIICNGVAEATTNIDGHQFPLRVVMEGDSFLCESVLCKVRRPCSLRACTYVDVFSMSMEGLQSVLEYHPHTSAIVFRNARMLYPDIHL